MTFKITNKEECSCIGCAVYFPVSVLPCEKINASVLVVVVARTESENTMT